MSDAMAILHKLQTGLDVNVKFTGVRVFEYTPECIVFDLLDIPLYHGWLVDPQVTYFFNNLKLYKLFWILLGGGRILQNFNWSK